MNDYKGQINRQQFFKSLAAGLAAGVTATLLHMQNSAPDWAGPYAPLAIAVVSSLLVGVKFLNSGESINAQR